MLKFMLFCLWQLFGQSDAFISQLNVGLRRFENIPKRGSSTGLERSFSLLVKPKNNLPLAIGGGLNLTNFESLASPSSTSSDHYFEVMLWSPYRLVGVQVFGKIGIRVGGTFRLDRSHTGSDVVDGGNDRGGRLLLGLNFSPLSLLAINFSIARNIHQFESGFGSDSEEMKAQSAVPRILHSKSILFGVEFSM